MEKLNFDRQIDSTKPCISISEVLAMLSEPFDQKGVAEKTHNKHFNNPESEYYQKSVEEIMEMWSNKGKVSMRYGSMLDNYAECVLTNPDGIELYRLDYDIDGDERLQALCSSFDNFYESIQPDCKFVDREKTLYYDMGDFYVKGRFDALFFKESNGHYIVFDWKSSGTVDTKPTQWTKKLLGPAKELDELNGITYTMQTYFYKMALLNGGYLPEGTMVDTAVVQLPGHICENGKDYQAYPPQFPYDETLMKRIFTFAFKKKQIMNR